MWDDLRRELEMDARCPAVRRGVEEGPGAEDNEEEEVEAIVPCGEGDVARAGSVEGEDTSLGRQRSRKKHTHQEQHRCRAGSNSSGAWAKSPRPRFRCNTKG